MSDQQQQPGAGGPDPEAGRVQGISEQLAALKNEILSEVKQLVGAARSGEADAQAAAQRHETHKLDRPSDLSAQIEAAVSKVWEGKQREQQQHSADEEHRQAHEALKKAAAERPPVERRRAHRFMGWGEPAA